MAILICPECAFGTDDGTRTVCDYCRSDLIQACPICGSLIAGEKTMFCASCGEKLRISIVPIQ